MMPEATLNWDSTHHARNSDPETSQQSAESAVSFVNAHAIRCLHAIKTLGGATQSEVAACVGLLPHQVNKRLADLHNKSLIHTTGRTRTGHTNRQEREWEVS